MKGNGKIKNELVEMKSKLEQNSNEIINYFFLLVAAAAALYFNISCQTHKSMEN